MVTVAIAGGTGGIGRTIAETINRQGKHVVKIFSRSTNDTLAAEIGCEIIAVDYDDVDGLTQILEKNKVDTVISTMLLVGSGKPQNNLILAADRSSVTRRFVPSAWAVPYTPDLLANFEIGSAKVEALEHLEKSNLEHTSFYVGYFLDYWGYPHVPTFQNISFIVVDTENDEAAIPGTGNTPVTFTHSSNTAEFVAASLDLPKWEHESYVVGDTVTWNDFVKIAEDVKGTKFKVTYDSLELLRTGKVTELPSHPASYTRMPKEIIQKIYSVFGVWFEEGHFNLQHKKTLNQVFPEIKVWTVREVLERNYKKK